MKTVIVIPARYGSTRLPGKPLKLIAGKTMLARVVEIARAAAAQRDNVDIVVATDDQRITDHCDQLGVKWAMTSVDCKTGTDRVQQAVRQLGRSYDFVLNLQGDAPLTPPSFLTQMIDAFALDPRNIDIVTPVVNLSWQALDALREDKKTTPFSGTCAILLPNGNAAWFSKNIIPAIRKEDQHREASAMSPVYRHIGLYGYSRAMLDNYADMPESLYEKLEGLEQLRALENGKTIRCVKVSYAGRTGMSGVDSPEDIDRAEAVIAKDGDLIS